MSPKFARNGRAKKKNAPQQPPAAVNGARDQMMTAFQRRSDERVLDILVPYAAALALAIAAYPYQQFDVMPPQVRWPARILVICYVLWLAIWLYAIHSDIQRMEMCLDYTGFVRSVTRGGWATVLALGISTGVAMAFVVHPVPAALCALILGLLNIAVESLVARNLRRLGHKPGMKECARLTVDVRKPYILLLGLRELGFAVALAIMLLGRSARSDMWAYMIIIGTLAGFESVMWYLRREFHRRFDVLLRREPA
jgi:hypothetical protein